MELLNLKEQLRADMPVTKRFAYFDHAAVGALAGPAAKKIAAWTQEAAAEGDTVWLSWMGAANEVRKLAAELIGADTKEIALVPNTTAGINLVAEGFPWQPGDNMVTSAAEFPSNLYPWMNLKRRGVECRRVESDDAHRVDLDKIFAACDANTKLISLSWVGYARGWRIDVDELVERAHQRGILVFLDAIQALGVFPIDVAQTPVDFLAADGHKWLLGPEGAGIFYVKQTHLQLLQPVAVGWNSVKPAAKFSHTNMDLEETAARYEGGSYNMVGMQGLSASLQMLKDWREQFASAGGNLAEQVIQETTRVCKALAEIGCEILTDRASGHTSGIVSFLPPEGSPLDVRKTLLDEQVVLSVRGDAMRLGWHAYNNEQDLERLIQGIKRAS